MSGFGKCILFGCIDGVWNTRIAVYLELMNGFSIQSCRTFHRGHDPTT
jgi:hypothetical protein